MRRLVKRAQRYLYHGTFAIYLDAILSEGVRPGNELEHGGWFEGGGEGVYVTTNYEMAASVSGFTPDEEQTAVLTLEVDPSKLRVSLWDRDNYLVELGDDGKYKDFEDFDKSNGGGYKLLDYGYPAVDNEYFDGGTAREYEKVLIPFNKDKEPFIGNSIFDVLHLETAEYMGTIPPSAIVKVDRY